MPVVAGWSAVQECLKYLEGQGEQPTEKTLDMIWMLTHAGPWRHYREQIRDLLQEVNNGQLSKG